MKLLSTTSHFQAIKTTAPANNTGAVFLSLLTFSCLAENVARSEIYLTRIIFLISFLSPAIKR